MKGDDLAAIKAASDQLQQASHAVAEQLYKAQSQPQGPQAGGESGAGKHSDVVDGEVVEV